MCRLVHRGGQLLAGGPRLAQYNSAARPMAALPQINMLTSSSRVKVKKFEGGERKIWGAEFCVFYAAFTAFWEGKLGPVLPLYHSFYRKNVK